MIYLLYFVLVTIYLAIASAMRSYFDKISIPAGRWNLGILALCWPLFTIGSIALWPIETLLQIFSAKGTK